MDKDNISKKLAIAFEWVDKNYDDMDEATKAAIDAWSQASVELIYEAAVAKGTTIIGLATSVALTAVVTIAATFGGFVAYDKWSKWRKNHPNKTKTTDSE